MRHIVVIVLFILLALLQQVFANEYWGTVVKVSDGDTITVLIDGHPQKIRMADIDAPEKSQAFGKRAKQFTSDTIFGQQVLVHEKGFDKYGRMIADIQLQDGSVLNRELVKAGYAHWYRKYSKDNSYNILEQEAKDNKRGLWIDTNPVSPWNYRHQVNVTKVTNSN